MLDIKISKLAYCEIDESKDYYNLQKDGLGLDFKSDIFTAVNNIASFPTLYPLISSNIRRCLLHRFPFSIFYAVRNNTVIILSVAHQHRKPKKWK